MDSRLYNYNPGPWNACNENFQAASLELPNSAPINREGHMMRDQNKAITSAASSFMFLNYPEDHLHQPNQHLMHRTQWQLPQWPKMKPHPSHSHKNTIGIAKDDWSGMSANVHAGSSLFNIPPPGPFCSADMTDRLIDNLQDTATTTHQTQGAVYANDRNHILETVQQMQQTGPKPAVKKSNPQPRKKREKKKPDKEKKKRTRNEDSWARNKRKKARARGEEYMSVVGKMMRAKEVQPVDCSKCKFHCPDHVTEEDRQKLFKHYWSLESFKDKVNFLSDCVEEFVPLRPISGKRLHSRRYKLKVGEGEDEKEARVCKEFFISTFDISESTIVTFMNKKRKNPEEIKDNRGHQIPSNKTPPEVVTHIREHILSQTGLQGCLSKSQPEEVKNMKRLYTHYQVECDAENRKTASMSVYRKVYGEMHKDKKEAPVLMPPDEVLDSIAAPAKKSKQVKGETQCASVYLDTDCGADEDDPVEPLPSEPLDSSPPTMPSIVPQQVIASSGSLAGHAGNSPHELIASHHHSIQGPRPTVEDKTFSLNIPTSHPPQQLMASDSHGMADNSMMPPAFDSGPHLNQLMPLMWGTHHVNHATNNQQEMAGFRGVQAYTAPNTFPSSNPNPMHSMTQSCLFSNSNAGAGPPVFPNAKPPVPVAPPSVMDPSLTMAIQTQSEPSVVVKKTKKPRPSNKIKPKKEVKKRTRNEESWGRNIRKRLRFKGEEYISVKGKTVGAKTIQSVDCSKCKYKCQTKVTEDQRKEMNTEYWALENYQKRIEFICKYVQTYVPKRKMTGRRAYSRNYTFIIDGKEIRVCKNFFITTLHISESIVATCLKKARKGPSAVKDMRGKHKPVNKTPEEVLQNIRELIIYLTGVRPKRKGDTSSKLAAEYQDINRLYLIYKYDSEKKGKKMASHGVFRNVLLNEFGFTGNTKFKKSLINKIMTSNGNIPEVGIKVGVEDLDIKKNEVADGEPCATYQQTGEMNAETTVDIHCVKQMDAVEVSEGSSTHPVFSTCLLPSL